MAAVEVTISGVLFDKVNRTTQNVVLVGEASLTGLGVGGGPVIPPSGGGGSPPGIWGPTDPRPGNPISGIPGLPGYEPPSRPPIIWGPDDPRPQPPIELPPDLPPTLPDQRPIDWKAAWTPETGWIVVGIPNVPVPTPSK